jgi:hypothetical protein
MEDKPVNRKKLEKNQVKGLNIEYISFKSIHNSIALGTTEKKAVTGMIDPSYTSRTQK